jgi:hypothetical protein
VPFDTPLAGPQTKNDAVFFGSKRQKGQRRRESIQARLHQQFAERNDAVEVTARGGVDAPYWW